MVDTYTSTLTSNTYLNFNSLCTSFCPLHSTFN
uniref:Uncharacterized protein n=1 Tax=Rhizophora mucronata TaxID=61149 RepID=A0A2P2QXF5_RHIMU